jgi:hypothetical protein
MVRKLASNCPKMESMMKLRRCKWLSKLSAMEETRVPRWTKRECQGACSLQGLVSPTPRLRHNPQQAIRHGYTTTLKILGFETKQMELEKWMTESKKTDRSITDMDMDMDHQPPQEWNPAWDHL